MNQAALQTEPTPAQRLADKILARTNNGRDMIVLMHDIAQGGYDANEYDRITASKIIFDRGYGKCPKQAPVQSLAEAGPEPSPGGPDGSNQVPDPAPETQDNDVGAIRESPPTVTHKEPESPRLVNQLDNSLHESLGPAPETDVGALREAPALRESPPTVTHKEPESPRLVNQLDNSLHESLGPAPSAHNPTTNDVEPAPYSIRGAIRESPEHENTDTSSLQSSIQDFIIEITNDGDTLIDVLMDIAYADPDNPKVKPFHRKYADRILMDRAFGTDPTPVLGAVQARPQLGQSVSHHPDYPPGYIPDPTKDCIYCSPTLNMPEGHEGEHRFDQEAWDEVIEKLKRMEDEGIITPDPDYVPRDDLPSYLPPEDWVPNPDEVRKEVAEFRAKLELQAERRKQWPEIEERRRKKLAQIYPSHSEGESPDT